MFGTYTTASAVKKGYKLPRSLMTNSDLTRIINSDEIQTAVRPQKVRYRTSLDLSFGPYCRIFMSRAECFAALCHPQAAAPKHKPLKKNPLKNLGAMLKLNPYAKAAIRREVIVSQKRASARQEKLAALRAGKVGAAYAFMSHLHASSFSSKSPETLFRLTIAQAVGPKKPKEQKATATKFYKQMVVDSEYQGEDYEVFSNWLGASQ